MNRALMEKIRREIDHEDARLDRTELRRFIRKALEEDIGSGDLTSALVLRENRSVRACLLAREAAVVAGLPAIEEFFNAVDRSTRVRLLVKEGAEVEKDQKIAEIEGPIRSLLKVERTMLNVLQNLTGIATMVHRCAKVAAKYGVRITDTRKTLPMMRMLQKYAVVIGGGRNHRFGLYDGVLIKDNHINSIDHADRPGAIRRAVLAAREQQDFLVEIEVESPQEAQIAAEAGADIIMLDNMSPAQMRKAVRLINRRACIEASGGITLKTLETVARTGVDFISIGSITHSVRAADLSLEILI